MSACSREEHCTMKRFCGDGMPWFKESLFVLRSFIFHAKVWKF